MGTSTNGVKHDRDAFLVYHLGFVSKSLLKLTSANSEKGGNNGKHILVPDAGESGASLVREATAVVASRTGVAGGFELELADVKYGGENLANLGNIAPWELKFLQGILEHLEALGVVDAHLELRGVAQVLPTLRGDAAGAIQSQVSLLGIARTCKKIVQNVIVPLTRRNIGNSATFEAVVKQLATQEDGISGGGSIVLKLIEEASLGGRRSRRGLGSREGVKDIC